MLVQMIEKDDSIKLKFLEVFENETSCSGR